MKKVLSIFVVLTLVFTSCSKERKLNKRMDGEWSVVTFNGVALPAGTSITIKFDKDKKDNGTYTTTQVDPSGTDTDTGTYTLDKDEKITMTSNTAGSTADVMTVTSYDKTDMTITQTDASGTTTIVLKKK